ncbi:MAG: HAMP domain-containing sensor histidine kinase [Gemmatimonadetes bacterium]|nr:HAMP domain-containing sensor histidine kinase [Gemmatimonadota bacterium]
MASIRVRITASYTLALLGTMATFTALLVAERRVEVTRELSARAIANADIGARMLEQGGVESQLTVITDSLIGQELNANMRRRLDAVPEFIIVADSARIIYWSPAVARLGQADKERISELALRLLPGDPLRLISLDSLRSDVIVAARLEDPRVTPGVRRVVAAVSAARIDESVANIMGLALRFGPVVVLIAILTAWLIAGRLLVPVDRMINDVEAISDGRSLHKRIPVDDEGDEVGRLGVTLNAMLARLEVSFAGLRRFTADASHELKTPLTVLRADIERAMTTQPGTTDQLVALEEALQETTRMADLVESLLTLARSDEGRFDIHREVVPLEPLVRDVAETANILGEEAGLTVTLGPIAQVSVGGDVVRLRQLFLNLITNAIKYTAKGGSVDISLTLVDGIALFAVKDTGIGIAGADLPFIFDRFWRVDRARTRVERGGVGLGLAISQWIAQAHGGSILVASRLGRGSTFTVSIPTIRDSSATRV